MSELLFDFRGVGFAFEPGRPVLQDVDFQLHTGERIGLTGPNGSGKTTFLHLGVGLLHPTSGELEAFGRRRRCDSDFVEVRRRAGLLFQDAEDQLFCPTVAEDVAFGPLNLGKSRDESLDIVRRTLDMLDLAGYEQRVTHKLSTGEKRLVALASVLAMRPQVLLLDEASAGLDEHFEQRVMRILRELDLAMIVVSHDRKFLRRVTDTTVSIRSRRLVAADGADL